jgi:hypothetical protein
VENWKRGKEKKRGMGEWENGTAKEDEVKWSEGKKVRLVKASE